MADLECYLCIASATSGASLNSFPSTAGISLGTCFSCGVFACGHHALRNSFPKGWECVICVPSNITSKSGRGGGPTSPTGGGPKGGPAPVATYGLTPYTEEEFVRSYPTSSEILRRVIRDAVADPKTVIAEYFGDNYEQRMKDSFEIDGQIDSTSATHIAAALAFITYSKIPDALLASHLQRREEAAGTVTMAGA
ncbi:MAG: hypothetical protein ACRD3K_14575 [Edaphobacter sp.]